MEFRKNNSNNTLANFQLIFRALTNRNYRLFFTGQTISLVGTWMQQMAVSWLVYRMTNSPLLLGVTGFIGQAPTFFIAPFAGVIADRYNRHRILIVTQSLAMIQAAVLSILVLTGTVEVWQILLLSFFLGLVNSFDIPVRQAFTIEMIEEKAHLGNAIALNSSMVNMAKLIGPSIAGIIIAVLGEGVCFLLNALSYVAVIISLLLMKIAARNIKPASTRVLHDLKEGFVYACSFAPIREVLVLLSLISLMGVQYQILMPIFARDIFHGGPQTLGFLMAMSGVGALGGALFLAGKKSVTGLVKTIARATVVFGLAEIVFSFSRVLWFSIPVICLAGFAIMVQMAASNTILQTIVEEDKRGRIMSFYTMSFMGMAPFGSLLAGILAHKIGAPYTLLIAGVFCTVAACLFGRKLPMLGEKINLIYRKNGIVSE